MILKDSRWFTVVLNDSQWFSTIIDGSQCSVYVDRGETSLVWDIGTYRWTLSGLLEDANFKGVDMVIMRGLGAWPTLPRASSSLTIADAGVFSQSYDHVLLVPVGPPAL